MKKTKAKIEIAPPDSPLKRIEIPVFSGLLPEQPEV
jgi:hypothetical protein